MVRKIAVSVVASVALAGVIVGSALPVQAQLNPFQRSGFELTPEDIQMLQTAAARLYQGETAEVGTVETWSNAASGNTGAVQLVQIFEHQGLTCRRLQHDIKINDVEDTFRYIFDRCKTASGEWKLL
ncbi:hypothetical protein [Pelagibius sp.]|uniref:hypothetical protein n=1 Tax=Pelagibius sp. TaxID=1931238 RepID=UPI003B508832